MTGDIKIIGEMIRKHRLASSRGKPGRGLSQEALSADLGVSQGLVNRWETTGQIRIQHLFDVAAYFGITAAELVGGMPSEKAAEEDLAQPLDPVPLGLALRAIDAAGLNDTDLDHNQRARVLILLHNLARSLLAAGLDEPAIMKALAGDVRQTAMLVRTAPAPQAEA